MEEILTPQICMEVDDTPLEVARNNASDGETSETGEQEIDDDEKVKILLESEFSGPAQVPDDLTDLEKDARKNVFAIGEPAVQFQRLHCTACNVHLGSAPIGHFNRFIHPLLKVLLCKTCFEFYRSGDFDKDEDGSEMYCRWCGQGGKVMCCAQCAYVFCQKCVRQNLGRKVLEIIKDSDDWMCFACSPTQLINLKIICTSLFEFTQEEIRLAKALKNAERLKIDHSVCCQKSKTQPKRKRDEDATYNPLTDWDEQIKLAKKTAASILKHTLTQPPLLEEPTLPVTPQARVWDSQDEDEVVCTPDLASLMEEEDKQTSMQPPPLAYHVPLVQMQNKISATPNKFSMQKPIRAVGNKKLFTLAPKVATIKSPLMAGNLNNRNILTNNVQQTVKPTSNFIRLQTPAIKFVAHPAAAVVNKTVPPPVVNANPAHIVPGLRHEWFEKAATIVSTITGNLSTTLVYLTKEQKTARTVEQLATVHNKLQELLSTSVNSLIQVRKNLRTEFLNDLNKLKFTDGPNVHSPAANNKSNKNNAKTNAKSTINNRDKVTIDDDDVILVNSDSSPSFPKTPQLILPKPPKTVASNEQHRPYLKVRSVSQLLSVPSECITIPDDPPPPNDDDISIVERDPLSFSPGHDTVATLIETAKVKRSKQSKLKTGEETNHTNDDSKEANKIDDEPVEINNDEPMEINKKDEELKEADEKIKETNTEDDKPKDIDKKDDDPKNIDKKDDDPKESNETEVKENNDTQLKDVELPEYDDETHLMIKNALAESKIDLLVEENSKCVLEDIPADELKKVLSVRVLLATKYRPTLPRNRLKTAEWFTGDIEAILSGNILIRHATPPSSVPDDIPKEASEHCNGIVEEPPDEIVEQPAEEINVNNSPVTESLETSVDKSISKTVSEETVDDPPVEMTASKETENLDDVLKSDISPTEPVTLDSGNDLDGK